MADITQVAIGSSCKMFTFPGQYYRPTHYVKYSYTNLNPIFISQSVLPIVTGVT